MADEPLTRRAASTLPRPLSIAMLVPCPFPTRQGTQVLIRHLAEALTRVGHEVHVVSYGYGDYEADYSFHLHRSGRVETARTSLNIMKPAADAALVMTAARVARTYRCDLWHVHNVEGLGLGALLKLQNPAPLVYHAHTAMGPELPTYFRAHLAQAFASMLGEVLDRTLPKAADAVIAFDDDHKALHEVYGIPEEAIFVIPPGLDGDDLQNPPMDEVDRLRARVGSGPVLLYAGGPDVYQNLPLMWEAFGRVRKARPEVTLLLASGDPAEAFAGDRQAAGNPGGVIHHQFTTTQELAAAFAVADLGLVPRTLWTGGPIKALNYLSVGLPVVACRSAARHVLTAACGHLVDGNAEAFAGAILELLEEPVGSADERRRVFHEYCIDDQVPAYEAVYRRVLGVRL